MEVKPGRDYSSIRQSVNVPFYREKTDLILTVTENHRNMPADLCTKLMEVIVIALLSCGHWVRTFQQQVIQFKKAKRQVAFLYLRNTIWHWGNM